MKKDGVETVMHSLRVDGWFYVFIDGSNTGTKRLSSDSSFVGFANFNDIEAFRASGTKVIEYGTRNMLGRDCKEYLAKMYGGDCLVWVYKGVVFKKEEELLSGEMGFKKATKFLERGVDVSLFEVPAGIRFVDYEAEKRKAEEMIRKMRENNE